MKIRGNAHTHTIYCDGFATPRQMAEAAVAMNMEALGFSGHSPMTSLGEGWTMEDGKDRLYREDVAKVKREFADRLTVFCGVEWDLFASGNPAPYDYVIGSLHVMRCADGNLYSFDDTIPEMDRCKNLGFYGDGEAIPRCYYQNLDRFLTENPSYIIGHFDILRKFNRHNVYFDEDSQSYRQLAMDTLEKHVTGDRIFEVNTSGMASGYLDSPYPDYFLLECLHELGGQVMLSSDAHTMDVLTYGFEEMVKKLREIGFKRVIVLTPDGFEEQPI